MAKPLTKKQIKEKIAEVLKTGKWMIRRSNNGVSYNNFKWNPVGVWTECPDEESLIKMGYTQNQAKEMAWNQEPRCGGGLHGNGPKSGGYYTNGKTLEFCAVKNVVNLDDKIKCQRAMILIVDGLPSNLKVGGSLDLSGTQIKTIPSNLKVGGYLDLSGTQIKTIPSNLKVGGSLDLSGTQIKTIPSNLKVGGYLDLSGTQIKITDVPQYLKYKTIF